MKFSELTAQAGEFVEFVRSLFPRFLADISDEDREKINQILARLFLLVFMLIDPLRRDRAMVRIKRNFNTLEFMVIDRAIDEQKENLSRLFKIVGKGAVMGASLLPVVLMRILSGEDIGE